MVVVPFPYSDLTSVKRRPVLIVSNDTYNVRSDDVVTCGITSNPKSMPHSVLLTNDFLVEGEIPMKSQIKADKLFTISKSRISKKVALASDSVLGKVKKELWELFSL